MDKWITTKIHTMEYYSALKRKEVLTHAMAKMKLEDIMLSETSQPQKDKYYMIPLIRSPRIDKFIEKENHFPGTRVGEIAELVFNGYRILFSKIKIF